MPASPRSAVLLSSCWFLFHTAFFLFVFGRRIRGTLLGSSYTAEDADIIGANEDYKALEAELRSEIDNIESTHPGYDEYRYNLAEINHNPYVLTSYLTVKYED